MNVKPFLRETACLHLEKRVIERISRGVPTDKRPDLIIWVCHFPLPSAEGIQCPAIVNGTVCPHNGPYGVN